MDLKPAENHLIVRAWDSAVQTQPDNVKPVWNFKGYMNNAWHRINVLYEKGSRSSVSAAGLAGVRAIEAQKPENERICTEAIILY